MVPLDLEDTMPTTLTLKNIPDEVYVRLKASAEGLLKPLRFAAAHVADRALQCFEWPKPVKRLERNQHDQPEREQRKTADERAAKCADLRIKQRPALRNLEPPDGLRCWQDNVTLGDAQYVIAKLLAVKDPF